MSRTLLFVLLTACAASTPNAQHSDEERAAESPADVRAMLARLDAVARAPRDSRGRELDALEALTLDGEAAEAQRSCAVFHRAVLGVNGAEAIENVDVRTIFAAQETCRSALRHILTAHDLPLDALSGAALPPIDLTLRGELDDADPRVEEDNSPFDGFLVLLDKDWYVRIEMRSTDLDTYLWLLNPAGESVVQDDDSLGEGTNSLVRYEVADRGVFTVRANSYDASGRGRYELHIVAPAPRDDAPVE
jgi:hypothetical protein